MHPHALLIHRFYESFQGRDAAGMIACYHPDVRFSDPVFPDLQGWRAGAMWRMLCARGKDLVLEFDGVEANDTEGQARWLARYTFSGTGRPVENHIQARFRFQDGRIIEHRDTFDLWAWTRQALGAKGVFLGWLPPVQNAVRKQAASGLASFIEKHALHAGNIAEPPSG